MVSRLIRLLALQTTPLSIFSIFASLLGFAGVVYFFRGSFEEFIAAPSNTSLLGQVLGAVLLIFILLRSVFGDLHNVLDIDPKIPVGTGIEASSKYGFRNFADGATDELFIIGQNIRTLLSDRENLEHVAKLLRKNPVFVVTFILTTDEAMCAISPHPPTETMIEFKQTIRELSELIESLVTEDEKQRVRVHFHRGASSLSAIIRDPKKENRAEMVFTPKWSTELEPTNRVYCVVRRWENPDIFKKLYGFINILTGVQSLPLSEMCAKLDVHATSRPISS